MLKFTTLARSSVMVKLANTRLPAVHGQATGMRLAGWWDDLQPDADFWQTWA